MQGNIEVISVKKVILIITIALFFVVGSSCTNVKLKYDIWKDTVEYFGDGTYQILHGVDTNGESVESLSNLKYNQCLLTIVDAYKQLDNNVYFIGEYETADDVRCVVDANTNVCKYYAEPNTEEEPRMVYAYDMQKNKELILIKDYNDFSEQDRAIFQEMLENK